MNGDETDMFKTTKQVCFKVLAVGSSGKLRNLTKENKSKKLCSWAVVAAKWLEPRSHNLEAPISNPPGARAFYLLLLLSTAECP